MGFLLDRVLEPGNMERAFNRARRKGTTGIDNVCGKDISNKSMYLNCLCNKIISNQYVSKPPIVKSKIDYDGNKIIKLQIASFEDQVIEFAIRNILSEHFQGIFDLHPNSSRRGKERKNFIDNIKRTYNEKNNYIVTDLENFTNSINIDMLYEDLYKQTEDGEIIDLIDKSLFSYYNKNQGLPLGRILTTFLPNIYLIDIEKELFEYYRYFDCFVFPFFDENPKELLQNFTKNISKKFLRLNNKKTKVLKKPTIEVLLSTVEGV